MEKMKIGDFTDKKVIFYICLVSGITGGIYTILMSSDSELGESLRQNFILAAIIVSVLSGIVSVAFGLKKYLKTKNNLNDK